MKHKQLFQPNQTVHPSLQSIFSNLPHTGMSLNLLKRGRAADLIVFSHLRWDFVFQRPQHIMTRLAKKRRVFFIEEPIPFDSKAELGTATITSPLHNVIVVQPKLHSLAQSSLLGEIVKKVIKKYKIESYATWFYSASFIDVLSSLEPQFVAYDCMDELGAFKGAPQELIDNEKRLLKLADIVFTGGKSLYESKSKQAENVYCYPSSVDTNHFQATSSEGDLVPRDIRHIKGPIAGFYGVIDERMDLQLLEHIARNLSHVTFLMIGPTAKINPADLPKNKNILYLGQKSYNELPSYLAGIDVAIMPFALNEATRFISPTKTLEFLAAGKPTISTPIVDVVRDYANVVEIAHTHEDFVTKLMLLFNESSQDRSARIVKGKHIVKQTSWDKTVSMMESNMRDVQENKYQQQSESSYTNANFPNIPWSVAYDQT